MSKIICIDNSPGRYNCAHRLLTCGNTYNAEQCRRHVDSYVLAEVMIDPEDNRPVSFKKIRFVPVSDIDETARLEAWQAERLTHVDKMLKALAEEMPEVEMPQESFERVWENVKATL